MDQPNLQSTENPVEPDNANIVALRFALFTVGSMLACPCAYLGSLYIIDAPASDTWFGLVVALAPFVVLWTLTVQLVGLKRDAVDTAMAGRRSMRGWTTAAAFVILCAGFVYLLSVVASSTADVIVFCVLFTLPIFVMAAAGAQLMGERFKDSRWLRILTFVIACAGIFYLLSQIGSYEQVESYRGESLAGVDLQLRAACAAWVAGYFGGLRLFLSDRAREG